jgi:very-short-patch-repair endonuclease
MQVIENNFEDRAFVREYPIGRFSIDFAWPTKKIAIEIDGEQHDRPVQKARDLQKDQLLMREGWVLLRIRWVEMYSDPKNWIATAKRLVDGTEFNKAAA